MDRSDLLLASLGGAGGRLCDTIISQDSRFQGLFINTSITDLESLTNYNPLTKNFICISQQNGVGRNREVGKSYAEQYAMTILDSIMKCQQKVIYLTTSLGGGSGSSILVTLLRAITTLKEDGVFDKTINLIAIIPDIKSPSIILENSLDTWSEITKYGSCINSMLFVDNGSEISNEGSSNDKEININEKFATMFDSIFDIPDSNGVNFDNGNLGNILTDKGCLNIYQLPTNYDSIDNAMRKAEQTSILASAYKNKNNTITLADGKKVMKCGYIGVSLCDDNYNAEDITSNYSYNQEPYIGTNEENNIVLVSGCLPPYYTMEVLELELSERVKTDSKQTTDIFFKEIVRTKQSISKPVESKSDTESEASEKVNVSPNKNLKKVMKKNLFKR